jgi:2-polyprenyl-3-methyl-5-hydroxy-6-metoxy-1,4-benzoquinol methylase
MAAREITVGARLLDWVAERIERLEVTWDTLDTLFDGLYQLRRTASPEDWGTFIHDTCTRHPLRHVLHQEPITRRSSEKPRGYSGDAVLLDLIYRERCAETIVDHSSTLGKMIYTYNIDRPSASSLRLRRDLIATMIDEVAAKTPFPDILSIACGHLRELHLTRAFPARRLGRIVGLDHDPETIHYVQEHLAGQGIQTVQANALHLLKGTLALGQFDLIYVSGLFDYLNQTMAQRMAQVMFKMLKPGGRILIINAVPAFVDACYMEAFMAWDLIYRDLDEMAEIAAALPREDIAEQDIFLEEAQHFAFLQIERN